MAPPTPNVEVNIEALKLLLQVAWADNTLDPKEREAVGRLGAAWGVPEEVIQSLLRRLDLGTPLPQPNLGLLRQHKEIVLSAAAWFVGVDGVVDDTEKELLATIAELLG